MEKAANGGERFLTLVAWAMLATVVGCATSEAWLPWFGEPSEWKKPDGFTATGTLLLAAFTLGLWFATYRLYREAMASSETATQAARAATATAEAMTAAERAYLFVEVQDLDWGLRGPSVSAQIKVWNYGKTPAILRMVRGYLVMSEKPPGALLEFPGSNDELPPALPVAPNIAFEYKAGPWRPSDADRAEIEGANQILYCVGVIVYEDVLGRVWRTSFCWELSTREQKYQVSRRSSLNWRT